MNKDEETVRVHASALAFACMRARNAQYDLSQINNTPIFFFFFARRAHHTDVDEDEWDWEATQNIVRGNATRDYAVMTTSFSMTFKQERHKPTTLHDVDDSSRTAASRRTPNFRISVSDSLNIHARLACDDARKKITALSCLPRRANLLGIRHCTRRTYITLTFSFFYMAYSMRT